MFAAAPEADRNELIAACLDVAHLGHAQGAGRDGFAALDRNLSPAGGGKAFLWTDVLTLADLWDAVQAGAGQQSPGELARLLFSLTGAFQRMQAVRVDLTREQFLILLAVRRGRGGVSTVEAIAAETGLDSERVADELDALAARHYRVDVPLAERDGEGWRTRF